MGPTVRILSATTSAKTVIASMLMVAHHVCATPAGVGPTAQSLSVCHMAVTTERALFQTRAFVMPTTMAFHVHRNVTAVQIQHATTATPDPVSALVMPRSSDRSASLFARA